MSKPNSDILLIASEAADYLGLKTCTIHLYSGPRGCTYGPNIPHVLGPRRGKIGPKLIKLFKRSDLDVWATQRRDYLATVARKVESAQEANRRLKAENTALKAVVEEQKILKMRIEILEGELKDALKDAAEQRAEKDLASTSLKLISDYNRQLQADLASQRLGKVAGRLEHMTPVELSQTVKEALGAQMKKSTDE